MNSFLNFTKVLTVFKKKKKINEVFYNKTTENEVREKVMETLVKVERDRIAIIASKVAKS